ncbi:hypothetical protein NXS98_04560 [Fontisphaera persica]|uniref:hypothetical protein n=1 Tax=Fontisphaera persica TaxID=2974023 RepID=UPI0024C0516F|nr:hypothetical protein [Fontisphaera persica]WCJ60408.1 hypothetical protein NXS98_04560 [Fontisphaera persica]
MQTAGQRSSLAAAPATVLALHGVNGSHNKQAGPENLNEAAAIQAKVKLDGVGVFAIVL